MLEHFNDRIGDSLRIGVPTSPRTEEGFQSNGPSTSTDSSRTTSVLQSPATELRERPPEDVHVVPLNYGRGYPVPVTTCGPLLAQISSAVAQSTLSAAGPADLVSPTSDGEPSWPKAAPSGTPFRAARLHHPPPFLSPCRFLTHLRGDELTNSTSAHHLTEDMQQATSPSPTSGAADHLDPPSEFRGCFLEAYLFGL